MLKVINKVFIDITMKLPEFTPDLQKAHDTWKNSDYEIKYWSGEDCEKYLIENFPPEYINTFRSLNAFAYKGDFFRYCLIYNEGGFYSDWKQELLIPLNNIIQEHITFVACKDNGNPYSRYNNCIADGFFGASKNHPILKNAIEMVIQNVKNKFYGVNPLDPTGPRLFGEAFIKTQNEGNINMDKTCIGVYDAGNGGDFFTIDNINFIKHKYDNSREQNWINGNNYNHLWYNRTVYS